MRRLTYQTHVVTLPNTTANDTIIDFALTLKSGYRKCTGIGLSDAGSANNYKLGLMIGSEFVLEQIPQEALEFGSSQPGSERFFPVEFLADNQRVVIRTTTRGEQSGDTVAQVVFRLENEE